LAFSFFFPSFPFEHQTKSRVCIFVSFFSTASLIILLSALALNAAEPAASPDDQKTTLAVDALTRLQNINLDQSPKIKEAVFRVLEKTRGTPNFVKLVQHFKIPGQESGLLEVATRNPTNELGVQAMRLVLDSPQKPLIEQALAGTNSDSAVRTAEALGNTGDKSVVPMLSPIAARADAPPALRRQAVRSLAKTLEGSKAILDLAKADKLPEDVKFTASSELSRARWPEVRDAAATLLPPPPGQNNELLPPIAELLKRTGDPAMGRAVLNNPAVGCSTCHRVQGQGVDFGPDLSEIGTKLGKDALYEAILDPSAGISFGYEAWNLQLKSGDEAYGLLASETADEIAIKVVGGIVTRYKKADILKREQSKLSIMPSGLQRAMRPQDLVNLVEYLSSLKKPN